MSVACRQLALVSVKNSCSEAQRTYRTRRPTRISGEQLSGCSMEITSAAPDANKPYAWKVPRGGERSLNAVCYYAGAWMAEDIKNITSASLKHVPESKINDRSAPSMRPVTETVDEHWRDEAHVPDTLPELAHINVPREGDIIGDAFELHYVDPSLRSTTQKIRLVFTSRERGSHAVAAMDLETFGNQYKGRVARPLLVPGAYTLVVQMIHAEGDSVDKASVRVQIVEAQRV